VTRHTRLDDLVARFNTLGQAKFYVEHLGADFQTTSPNTNITINQSPMPKHARSSRASPRFSIVLSFPISVSAMTITVVVLGQDGLVANTRQISTTQNVIGVNPDPTRWEGVLLPFAVTDLKMIVPDVFAKKTSDQRSHDGKGRTERRTTPLCRQRPVHRAEIALCLHDMSFQSVGIRNSIHSSGIIVSTGLGSTGWLKSILAGHRPLPAFIRNTIATASECSFTWDADFCFYGREPFPSKLRGDIGMRSRDARPAACLCRRCRKYGRDLQRRIESDFLNSIPVASVNFRSRKKGHLVV